VEVPSKISVLCVGLDGGGKTSILNALQGKFGKSVRATVGFSCAKMQLSEETVVEFFDLGGGAKIRSTWSKYYADVHGLLYVVDSADASRTEEATALFKSTCSAERVSGKPMLVLANKSDCDGARGIDAISTEFGASSMSNCKVVSCTATGDSLDGNIESGLEWLFQKVITQYPQLKQRVESELLAQSAEAAAAKAARARKVLKQLIERAFGLGPEGEKTEVLEEQEGYKYLADEISSTVDQLEEKAKEACRLVGFQRLAVQMIGEMKVPVSKKKTPWTLDEILAHIRELREELKIPEDAKSIPSAE